jgi:excisionase family DNA binding protein
LKREQAPESKYMSPKEAAEHFGVHVNTILNWIKAGKIQAIQPAGRYGRLMIPR